MANKKIYATCGHCKGTGKILLTNADLPSIEEDCKWCEGQGKVLFGEVEKD